MYSAMKPAPAQFGEISDMKPMPGSSHFGVPMQLERAEVDYGTGLVFLDKPAERLRLNSVAVAFAALFPWAVFCGLYAALSFSLHRSHAAQVHFLLLCAVLSSGAFVARDMLQRRKALLSGEHLAPSWLMFLGASTLFACVLALLLGNWNFATNSLPYYSLNDLGRHADVDPSSAGGLRYMDAGIVRFTADSFVEAEKAIGFKHLDTFCVAPITRGDSPLATYDFWAVGVNCCNGFPGDFKCGDYLTLGVHSGLRVMRDELKVYYSLAVQQAQAEFHIQAAHPVFLEWVHDPQANIENMRDAGRWYFIMGAVVHLALQCALTVSQMYSKKQSLS